MFRFLNNLSIRASLFFGFGTMCAILIGLTIITFVVTDKVSSSLDKLLEDRIPATIDILRVAKAADALVSSATPLGFNLANSEARMTLITVENRLNALKKTLNALDSDRGEVAAIHTLVSTLDNNIDTLKLIVLQRHNLEEKRNKTDQNALLNLQNFQQNLTHRIRILQGDSSVIEYLVSQSEPPLLQTIAMVKTISTAMPIAQFYSEMESLHARILIATKSQTKMALDHEKNILDAILSNALLTFLSLPLDLRTQLEVPFDELQNLILSDAGVIALREQELSLLADGRIIVLQNREITQQIGLQAEHLVMFGVSTIDEAKTEVVQTRNHFFLIMLSISIVGLIALVFLMYFHIHKHIISRLSWLSQSMQDVAAGKLDIKLPPCGNNELGRLGYALEIFWRKTKEAEQREVELRKSSEASEQARQALHMKAHALSVANDQLAELSVIDSLTGLYNRRRFDEALLHEWDRAGHAQQPMSLIMLDIDHFKEYNDYYGHQEGDECLRKVAAVLQKCARRASDLAARYGGEEFCIISAYTSTSQAESLAEDIRSKVEKLAIEHQSSEVGVVTVSVGLAVLKPEKGYAADRFLRMVDKALYLAKESGRNCVKGGG